MALQAAVAVTLAKAGGGPDIPMGTPVAGRSEAELADLVGFFVNFVVLRNDLRGNPTLREILVRAREMALSAYSNADVPFEQVVEVVNPPRSLSRNPLFQVVVHVREQLPRQQMIDDRTSFTALEPSFDMAQADLSLNFFADAQDGPAAGYRGHVIYRPELYDRATIQRLTGWLDRIVTAFAEHPDRRLGDVEIITAEEKQRIVTDWAAGANRVYVLDDALAPVPVGVLGDVYLGGTVFTGDKLVGDPFSSRPGARLYRTGDRGRWDDDGRLHLAAATVPGDAEVVTRAPATEWEEPRTASERALAALLTELLGAEDVGRHDDFFGLGGDSVLAVQLAARARDAGLDLTARMVFEHPALAELAAALDAGSVADPQPDDVHHEPMSASGLSEQELAALTASWSGGEAPR